MGLDNNNPGNLRDPATGGFQTFDSPDAGIAAMRNDLAAKVDGNSQAMAANYGPGYTPTIRNVISTYAPPTENDTENYIKYVAGKSGIDPDKPLQPQDVDAIMPHMLAMEGSGKAKIAPAQVASAAPAALAAQPQLPDTSGYSDQELAAIASGKPVQTEPDTSGYSDAELQAIAAGKQPTANNGSFIGDMIDNAKGGVNAAKDLVTGNFETPLNPRPSVNADKIVSDYNAGGLSNTHPADYAKLLLEKFSNNPAGKAITAIGGLVPEMNAIGAGVNRYVNPAIQQATGADPATIQALELIGGAAAGAKGITSGALDDVTLPSGAPARYAAEGAKNTFTGALADNAADINTKAAGLDTRADGLYKAGDAKGVMVSPQDMQTLAKNMTDATNMPQDGALEPDIHPATSSVVGKINDAASSGAPVELGQLERWRQQLGDASGSDAAKAGKARDAFDSTIASVPGGDTYLPAREAQSQAFAFQTIGNIIKNAGGDANKLKAGFTKFVNNPDNMKGLSPEADLVQTAADRNLPESALKLIGKASPVHGVVAPASIAALADMLGGGGLATGALGLGTLGRVISNYLARGKAQNVLDAIEDRQPAAPNPNTPPVNPGVQAYPAGTPVGPQPQLKLPAPQPVLAGKTPANTAPMSPAESEAAQAGRANAESLGSNPVGHVSDLANVVKKALLDKFGEPAPQQISPRGNGPAVNMPKPHTDTFKGVKSNYDDL